MGIHSKQYLGINFHWNMFLRTLAYNQSLPQLLFGDSKRPSNTQGKLQQIRCQTHTLIHSYPQTNISQLYSANMSKKMLRATRIHFKHLNTSTAKMSAGKELLLTYALFNS